jgi:hypothetical protein
MLNYSEVVFLLEENPYHFLLWPVSEHLAYTTCSHKKSLELASIVHAA